MKKPIHTVSDHAVLRYLQRAHGVDVEGIRRDLGRRVDQAVGRMEFAAPTDCSAAHIDGMTLILKGRVVITVLERKASNRRPE